MFEVWKKDRRNLNIYKNKRLVFINIDHIVRYSLSGNAYIIGPDDIGIVRRSLPILRKLNKEGYIVIGISAQMGVGKYGFESSEFLTGLKHFVYLLKPERMFDWIYYSWECTYKYFDKSILIDAMSNARVFRRQCLYVGYSELEAEACRDLNVSFVNYEEFFNTLVWKHDS